MGKIGRVFTTLLLQRKKAFIPFFTAFYPSIEIFKEFLLRADDVGADFIEIGIPFSDPLADGKAIQYSSQWAIRNNFSFSRLLEETASLKESLDAPLILMSYFNPILQRGIVRFGREIKEAGIEGVIVPNLPFEESASFRETLFANKVDLIYLVAPTSSPQRIKEISRRTQGFIYLVSLTGVTGKRERLPANLVRYINTVKEITTKPLCVGFGISDANQARKVADLCDGVIVGSALVSLLKGRELEKNIPQDVEDFLRELEEVSE